MIQVRQIQFTEYVDAASALAVDHAREIEPELGAQGPQLQKAIYAALEDAGSLVTFGAFDGEELIGYSVAILGPHLHYGFTYAHHDLLYVAPSHRKGALGLRLIRATEAEAKARGARCATWHAKPGSTLQRILDRLGYVSEETVYLKEF